ncbi:MAG: hypothetical protein AB8B55_07660 [Mariniblastus sp.]
MESQNDEQYDRHSEECTRLDRILAVPMFVASILFLIGAACLLHLTDGDLFGPLGLKILILLGFIYLFFVAETIAHWKTGGKNMKQHIRFLLLPIMRICPRDHAEGKRAWIPGIGWRLLSSRLEKYLARLFSGPMIVIALLVLPVVAVEFFYAEQIAANWISKRVIELCSAFIWMAFVFEFVVMVSIVEKKVRYCKQNWIDLAVVLLPLVSFMGAARLGRLVKLKQLSRTAKIYRMRGLAIRSWRAVVALDVIDTILRRDPEQRMDRLQIQIDEKQEEIEYLRNQLEKIRERWEKEKDDDPSEPVVTD